MLATACNAAAPAARRKNARRGRFMAFLSDGRVVSSLPRQVEIAQIRWWLILLDRHQEAVGAEEIVLLADDDMNIVFGADVLAPPDRSLGGDTAVVLGDGPGPRQRIVDHGDLVVQHVRISLVEINPFLDHGLAVRVEGNAAGVVGARVLETA